MNYYICVRCGSLYCGWATSVICEKCGGGLEMISWEQFYSSGEIGITVRQGGR